MELLFNIIYLSIIIEITLDAYQFRTTGEVYHGRGWIIRGITAAAVALLFTWEAMLIYGGVFTLIFSPAMGIVVAGSPIHIGNTSSVDKFLRKLFKVPLGVLAFRLMLGLTLLGFYYFPGGYAR